MSQKWSVKFQKFLISPSFLNCDFLKKKKFCVDRSISSFQVTPRSTADPVCKPEQCGPASQGIQCGCVLQGRVTIWLPGPLKLCIQRPEWLDAQNPKLEAAGKEIPQGKLLVVDIEDALAEYLGKQKDQVYLLDRLVEFQVKRAR